jgi:hypothetical protein
MSLVFVVRVVQNLIWLHYMENGECYVQFVVDLIWVTITRNIWGITENLIPGHMNGDLSKEVNYK